jgi:hypothetical protein
MSECPVDSFKDAYPFLRRPFTPAAVRFKVQATWKGGALIVAYIDARLAAGRLNHVIPHKWASSFEYDPKGDLICHLTVDGITRSDIGEGYKGKGLWSDALKRAAVHFGVGESLYVLPKMTLNEGQLLKAKEYKGKTTYILTPMGVTHCREVYEHWLESTGKQAFGEPLDHGDVLYEEVDEPVTEPSPMDLFTELARGFEFTDEEKAAIWQYVQVSDENLASATELLEDGNRGALIAGVEFDVKAAA